MRPDSSLHPPGGCVTSGPIAPSLGHFSKGMKMLDWPIQFAKRAFKENHKKISGCRGVGGRRLEEAGGLTCPPTSPGPRLEAGTT